ncbi:hypothetical protein PZA11_003223 [Diplocarpon coronariae]|uniref:Transcription factor Cys n=1 Tax=Diplocarpon coronariae TaxID=2795749 RepID=A0A218YV31_9HELO|nr:hypothetical protein JHW43_009511 [Diplocarpon mali]OWO99508.1 transcription factor Cys [Marssonina coronariae]
MEPFTSQKHRASPTNAVKPPRKRKRIVISCTECHRRKQKCDRQSPCSNCVARSKQSLCHYENESLRKQQLLEEGSTRGDALCSRSAHKTESETAAQVSAFGYAKSNGSNNTTLGIFKKIENLDSDPTSRIPSVALHSSDLGGLKEKYKSMIRQLPAKPYIEQLVACFFHEVNWQYCPLDEATFRDLLKDWHSLSFATLNKGPQELPPDLQFFPALLFQTLALALQFQPIDYDQSLDSLKYAAGMSFDDLASDYSESGCQILCLLGKRHTTLVTVQAGFLRTAYLKNCGLVPESWHYLSQNIRDAQEIGLHKPGFAHARRKEGKPKDVLENLWLEQLRHRMWLILSLWDIHMAIVLGRPATIDPRDGKPSFPIDAPIPFDRRLVAPSPRTESDPPTPLTMLLWNAELCAPLWDIFNLEKEDPHQNDYAQIELMHQKIKALMLYCPPFFRASNPDTTFDAHPDCYWLPCARSIFQTHSAFAVMALHRPYIFTHAPSRTAALKAGLDILRAQRTYFTLLSIRHYKMFCLVLNTFDAIVLVAAIYLLHPNENPEDLEDALQHFQWGMDRFQTMGERNAMASAALGVLRAICVRLKKALHRTACPVAVDPQLQGHSSADIKAEYGNKQPLKIEAITSSSVSSTAHPTPEPSHPSAATSGSNSTASSNSNGSAYTQPTISNLTSSSQPTMYPPAAPSYALSTIPTTIANTAPNTTPILDPSSSNAPSPWASFPVSQFDFSSMPTLQPTHDLLFNDLGGTPGLDVGNIAWGGSSSSGEAVHGIGGAGGGAGDGQWQFEGAFGEESFWGFMNSYNP